MIQILAGLVGGLLALAGGYSVQVLGARERRAERARSLAAAWLTETQQVLIDIARKSFGHQDFDTLTVLQSHGVAARSGAELGLLASPELREAINERQQVLLDLIFGDPQSPEWESTRDAHRAQMTEVRASLAKEFGASSSSRRPGRTKKT